MRHGTCLFTGTQGSTRICILNQEHGPQKIHTFYAPHLFIHAGIIEIHCSRIGKRCLLMTAGNNAVSKYYFLKIAINKFKANRCP